MSEEDQDQDNEAESSLDDLHITDDDIEVIPDDSSGDGAEPRTNIFDLFEPPPEIDSDRFGPVPIVSADVEPAGDDVAEPMLMDPIDVPDGDDAPAEEGRSLGLFDSVPDDPNFIDHSDGENLGAVTEVSDINQEPEFASDELDLDVGAAAVDADGMGPDGMGPDDIDVDDMDPDGAAGDGLHVGAFEAGDDTPGLSVDELLGPIDDANSDVDAEAEAEAGDVNAEAEAASPVGDLPHWTDPPTGQVPVVGGDNDDEWSEVTGPQWQGEGDVEGDDISQVFADTRGVNIDEDAKIDDLENELADIPNPGGAPQRVRPTPSAVQEVDDELESGRNIPQAIAVGVIFAGIALFAFQLGAVATVALIAVVAVLAVAELYGAMRKVGLRPATLLGIVASAALPVAVYNRGESAFVMVLALVVVFGALWYIVGAETYKPALNLGLTMLGILWVGVLASFGSLIVLLNDGISILLAAICVTVAYDTFAFAGGKAFGSRPFHASSPNKTWEGTIVGVVAAVVAGFVVGLLEISPFSGQLTDALLLGLVAGILAPIGDLTESMIKRDLSIKDMGSILPGHGGILDRLDGLLFVLPGVYYLARVLELV